MNRRKLFGFLAAAPVGALATAKALAESKPVDAPIPVGTFRDIAVTENHIEYVTAPCHTHSISDPGHSHALGPSYIGYSSATSVVALASPVISARTVFKKEIYDGAKFVPFDSPEGTAVANKLFHG